MKMYKLIPALLLMLTTFGRASAFSDTTLIKTHLTAITKTIGYRTCDNIQLLNKTADYIKNIFKLYSDSISTQTYSANGLEYKNIICSFGTENTKRIILGAHYDVCDKQEGADDNATGITGLLELARMLKGQKLNYRIDLVAYTLEEPPYFRTEFMGSYIHAKSLADRKANVYGMISLEMIGYFKEEKHTQDYPIGLLSLFYGNRGNYITLVKKFGAGHFTKKFCSRFKSSTSIKTKMFTGPKSLGGIDFSDHLNYWKFGYSALMITDTAFLRNKNYHEPTDKIETLDLRRMAKVIDGVFSSLTSLN